MKNRQIIDMIFGSIIGIIIWWMAGEEVYNWIMVLLTGEEVK
jgi:hypothetical protein